MDFRRLIGARARPAPAAGLGPRQPSSSSTCCALLRRWRCASFSLVVAQIHAIGNRSLVIILASGLAVGFVLALQMYYALVTYGAAESWA